MLAFQAGDDSAFDEIVDHYRASVRSFLLRYLNDGHRCDDLTQEVFLRVYRSRRRYQPTAGFRTWVFTIATRLALNEIRSVRRRRRVIADPGQEADVPLADRSPDPRTESPARRLEREELAEVLDALIEKLPANQRAALILHRVEKLPYRDVAEALGVSPLAVKSLLMRARTTLRERLGPYLEEGRLARDPGGKPRAPGSNPRRRSEDP